MAPQALSQEPGQVLPDYVKVYQNNILVHVRSQQAQHQPRVKPSSPHPERPQLGPSSIQLALGPTIADLLSQIEELQADFEKFKHTHKVSSSEESSLPSSSPQAAPTILPNDLPSPPHPPSPFLWHRSAQLTQITHGCSQYWIMHTAQHSCHGLTGSPLALWGGIGDVRGGGGWHPGQK